MAPRKTILVVDDDWDILDAMKETLESEGYETVVAQNGEAGLDYLRTHALPGVILLDWNMAPMNGPAFMNELGTDRRWSGIPVVLLTADTRVENKARNGFVGYIAKPIDLDKLFTTVAHYCE
jgi:CheY-like chemotaxis protein